MHRVIQLTFLETSSNVISSSSLNTFIAMDTLEAEGVQSWLQVTQLDDYLPVGVGTFPTQNIE